MQRFAVLCCLMLTLSALPALETSLVMPQQGTGNLVAMLNPQIGELRLYQVSGSSLQLLHTVNVFTNLFFLANLPHPQESAYSRLRVGLNTEPAYMESMSAALLEPGRPRRNRGDTGPGRRSQAVRTENQFWEKPPEYDGVIRGAFGSTSLFLVVPSMRTILVYTLNNRQLELTAQRNFGPDLYIPGSYNSQPAPGDLLRALPQEQREAWERQMEAQAEEIAVNPDASLDIKDLDPWVSAIGSASFIVLEPNNQRLLSYRIDNRKLTLRSMRNLEVDLMVPPEASFQTSPNPVDQYQAYRREMERARIVPDTRQGLLARIRTATLPGAKITDSTDTGLQAAVDGQGNLVLDFTNLNKALVYNPTSGSNIITLAAVRDYSLDVGIALHREQIIRQQLGTQALNQAQRMNLRDNHDPVIAVIGMALRYNPGLHEEVEGNRRLAPLREHPDWAPMIQQAIAEKERLQAEEEARRELLEQEAANR